MAELKKDLSLNFRADRLDVAGLAQANGYLKGQNSLQKYERLRQESCRLEADLTASESIVWQAEGELIESVSDNVGGSVKVKPQVWLHLSAQTHLPQTCQRCLGEVSTYLAFDRSYRFVADEATAEAEDDECEEDLLAISREFNLSELIEDELLMALPQVPMHDVCPVQPKMAAIDAEFEALGVEGKPNPFAALAALKAKK
ncbi:MAG: hypothetical protein RI918_641 [Pseudomonadota bacterium]|jgi:uncharacterized protein